MKTCANLDSEHNTSSRFCEPCKYETLLSELYHLSLEIREVDLLVYICKSTTFEAFLDDHPPRLVLQMRWYCT